jgi:hypothetical protein
MMEVLIQPRHTWVQNQLHPVPARDLTYSEIYFLETHFSVRTRQVWLTYHGLVDIPRISSA